MSSATINSVERTLRLIEHLADNSGGKGIVQLAGETCLPPSTVHRALQTLCKTGYVSQEKASGRYRLTAKLLEVSSRGLVDRSLRKEAAIPLSRLRDQTRESAHLAVLDQGSVVTIESFMSTERNLISCQVGERLPLHCSSVGKCLLAYLDDSEFDRLVTQTELPRFTPETICVPAELKEELARSRARGYALDWDEYDSGVRCIAAPVRDMHGKVIAAVGISGPDSRITKETLPELVSKVIGAADAVSRALGAAL